MTLINFFFGYVCMHTYFQISKFFWVGARIKLNLQYSKGENGYKNLPSS